MSKKSKILKIDIVTAKFIECNLAEKRIIFDVLNGYYKNLAPNFERRNFYDNFTPNWNPVEHIKNPKYVTIGILIKPGVQMTSYQDSSDFLDWFVKLGWILDEEDINNIRSKNKKAIVIFLFQLF